MKKLRIAALLLSCASVCCAQTVDHPLHIGGDVKPPKIISQVDPDFSLIMDRKVAHSAMLYMVVDVDGVPRRFKLLKGSSPEFGRAFLEAVAKYRFHPATRDGVPVAASRFGFCRLRTCDLLFVPPLPLR